MGEEAAVDMVQYPFVGNEHRTFSEVEPIQQVGIANNVLLSIQKEGVE